MHEFILYSFLCPLVGLGNTFLFPIPAAFNNGTSTFDGSNTSSSLPRNQHALAVMSNHSSSHENNGNHYGNIRNGIPGNGNNVNNNQHENGNAMHALCRKICVG